MAMIDVTAAEVQVRCGWLDGRPRSIVLEGEEVRIVAIQHVRHESAAYPAERGPRTIFDVRTPEASVRLVFQHRRRRWLLAAVGGDADDAGGLAAAA